MTNSELDFMYWQKHFDDESPLVIPPTTQYTLINNTEPANFNAIKRWLAISDPMNTQNNNRIFQSTASKFPNDILVN